jgi:plastocyanin
MRRKLWSVAALVILSSGAALAIGIPGVQAADKVNMVEGPGDVTKTWKFEPASITIAAGSSVVWHNTGEQVHTATGDGFDTGDVGGGKDSKAIPFPTAGSFDYICTPHPWMKGTIVVTGGATPSTAATTPTTQAGTATTTPSAVGATTTTTAKASAGASTTTTTAAAGATTTTLAPGVTPTSAPEVAETTTTTAVGHGGGEEAAADDHASEGGHEEKEKKKNSPIGIAFASSSTVLLAAIAGKLLASKS